MKTIAVFFGGMSVEHDVSIVTGLQFMDNMDKSKYTPVPVYITRDGDWYTGEKLRKIEAYKSFSKADPELTRVYLPANTRARQLYKYTPADKLFKKDVRIIAKLDAAVLAMHGLHGEDGTLQGLLQLAGVPYTSSGVLGSAAGMDKILMKAAFIGAGLPVLPYVYFDRDAWREAPEKIMDSIEGKLPYPIFVKPSNLGSSIGISKAKNRQELEKAIEIAAQFDRRLLAEQGVETLQEINCSALGYGGDVTPSVCEMPVPWEEFLTYEDKYIRGGKSSKGGMQSLSRQIPAPISPELTKRIQDMSVEIFKLMDCKGVVRIDYILDKAADTLYVNEINTIPGSFAFYLWEPTGVSYPQLIDKLIDYALQAHAQLKQNQYAFDSEIISQFARNKTAAKLTGAK